MPTFAEITALVQSSGTSFVLLLFLIWFWTFRFWPWFTKDYFPALLARRRAEENERTTLREAISALTLTVQSIPASMQASLAANAQAAVPLALDVTAILTLVTQGAIEAKLRHEAVMNRIENSNAQLIQVYLGTHAKPANGSVHDTPSLRVEPV